MQQRSTAPGPEFAPLPSGWTSIPRMLRSRAEARPDAVLLASGAERTTAAGLAGQARRTARALIAAGVRPGDRVALLGPNTPQWAAAAFGVWDAGAVLVPLSTRFKGLEAADLLRRTGARLLLCTEHFLGTSFVRLIEGAEGPAADGRPFAGLPGLDRAVLLDAGPGDPAAERGGTCSFEGFLAAGERVPAAAAEERALAVRAGDLAEILATSGTTGAPKGVMIPHGRLLRGYWDWAEVVTLGEGDRYPVIAPFSHGFGVNAGLLAGVMRAAVLLPVPVFDPGALLDLITGEGVGVLAGPPTMFQGIMEGLAASGRTAPSLRVGVCGAASVPPELVRRLLDEGVVRRMINAYGLIEGTVVSMTRAGDPVETVAGSTGRAMPGVDVEVVGEDGAPLPPGERGEILVGGHGVMLGYWGDPERTAEALDDRGRLRTGDIGVLDREGNLSVVDRKKDMFIVGGFNAYPAEIEALLMRHPAVARAAVVPVPHPRLGEVGCAFVVPAPGSGASPAEITAWAERNMSNYKVPRRVVLADSLPANANGKIDKVRLRRLAEGAVAGAEGSPAG